MKVFLIYKCRPIMMFFFLWNLNSFKWRNNTESSGKYYYYPILHEKSILILLYIEKNLFFLKLIHLLQTFIQTTSKIWSQLYIKLLAIIYRVRNLWSAARIHLDSCQILHKNLFSLIQFVLQNNIFWENHTWDSRKVVQENLYENGFSDSHQISIPGLSL